MAKDYANPARGACSATGVIPGAAWMAVLRLSLTGHIVSLIEGLSSFIHRVFTILRIL